jgi:uncharacterized protein YbjQ (UPF0145 family)
MGRREPPSPERAEQEAAAEREQRESLERVERGGIPLAAERRLRELGEGAGAFTSDLSVGSFALCHELGLQPLAQVMGSSIYQVGYSGTVPSIYAGGFMYELEALSQAWNEVRERAFSRLAQEAAHLGAEAVVGVQLSSGAREFSEGAIECVVIGTAVRQSGRSRSAASPEAGAHTVLTELSVPDYAKLRRAGFRTLGVVAWTSVFFVQSWGAGGLGGFGGGFMQNQELTQYTQGVYEARETTMGRVTAQAAALGADGVVGVRIDHNVRPAGQNGMVMSFNAIGTAIRKDGAGEFPSPKTTIDLTEGATR